MDQVSNAAMADKHIYDCIGVGFGPSNIALAIALEERGLLRNALFLETQASCAWHPGMLIAGTDIQHNPLRDLVTPRNPGSPYGFLSYLKDKDRLFDYLNLAAPYPPRIEYAGYVDWVGLQFSDHVKFSTRVVRISPANDAHGLPLMAVETSTGDIHFARALSFATGRSRMIPAEFERHMGDDVVHLSDYLFAKRRWLAHHRAPAIAVIGGSQSAIEIVLDLLGSIGEGRIINVSRSFGFRLKDLSAFTEQIYYPEFVDYFHGAGTANQNRISAELWRSNYGAADPDVIAALNLKLYEQRVQGRETIQIRHNTIIEEVAPKDESSGYELSIRDRYAGNATRITVDGIVLATGFKNFGVGTDREPCHPLLQPLARYAHFREDGGIDITRDYRMRMNGQYAPVFVNGLCEASHGFGDAGSFSLLSVRSDTIAAALEDHLLSTQHLPMAYERDLTP